MMKVQKQKTKPKGVMKMSQMTYRTVGDYQIPNLTLPQEENVTLGKYGMLRKKFLQEHRKVYFAQLIAKGELMRTIKQMETEAEQMMAQLTEQLQKSQGVTEELKEQNQMQWVRMINNIRMTAEETVLKELIYS
ncbi:MAG: TnpV protein [Ruminococcus sp.]|nr:TnpV protein [Candidatus Copronaster equi]